MIRATNVSDAIITTVSSARFMRGSAQPRSTSTLTIAPCRNAIGMPKNTIQIGEKRIITSVHSVGSSSTNRVMIANNPSATASANIAHAKYMDAWVVTRSMRRNMASISSPVSLNSREALIKRLRRRITALCGARNPHVPGRTFRFLRATRLVLHPSRSLAQR